MPGMRQSLHSLTRRVMELFVRDTTAGDDDRLDARTGWQPEWGGEHIGRLSGADPASFVHVVGPCGDDSVRSAPFFIPRTICLPPHFCGSPFVSASWCCRNRGQASRASCVCVCVCAYGMVCFAWLSHGWMDGWMDGWMGGWVDASSQAANLQQERPSAGRGPTTRTRRSWA